MSKKAITAGIIVSSVCLFLYSVLVIAQYVSYISVFWGGNTVGGFIAGFTYLRFFSSWLVTIAAFFPMMLLLRRILRWKKGVIWVILIVGVIVIPQILSLIGSICSNLCIDSMGTNEMMPGIIGLTIHIQSGLFADAISAFVWAAVVSGLGLAGKAAIQPALQPAPPAEENHFNPAQDTPLE